MFAGPDIGGFGARRQADALIPVDKQAVNAALPEFYGQTLPYRASSDDEYLRLDTR